MKNINLVLEDGQFEQLKKKKKEKESWESFFLRVAKIKTKKSNVKTDTPKEKKDLFDVDTFNVNELIGKVDLE